MVASAPMARPMFVVLTLVVSLACVRPMSLPRNSPETVAAAELPDGFELVETWPVETTLDDPTIPEAHEVWLAMIGSACERLDFLQFYGASEPGGRLEPVIEAITEAAARGVRARFVFDASFHERQPEIPDRLAAIPGVEVRIVDLRPITGGVQHTKLFVVDDAQAYVGSQNFDWRSLEHIQELGARITEPTLVARVREVFELDWALAGGATREALLGGDTSTTPQGEGDEEAPSRSHETVEVEREREGGVETAFRGEPVRARVVASPRDLLPREGRWEWPLLRDAIASARERVRLQVMSYQIRGHDGEEWSELDALLRATASRGVRVELVVSSWETRPGRIEALQSLVQVEGIKVRIVTIPEASTGFIPYARTVHAKYATVDGRVAWLGTSNAGGDYFLRSRNVGLFVEGAAFARALDVYFDRVWNSSTYAEPVDPTRTYERPRIAE
jgi:phosphatidylserine/phosphatidylglycerophosphate/cardiolipin synthase-like enzyme